MTDHEMSDRMKYIGGLYAIAKGGKHDGHEVLMRSDIIYCITCDKIYLRCNADQQCADPTAANTGEKNDAKQSK